MKKSIRRELVIAISLLLSFALWTAAIQYVDVQAIGPRESAVGFARLNQLVHHLTGVHMALYTITDWLGLVPVAFGFSFAVLGLVQWIKRKSILKVDSSILLLGAFYLAVMAAYVCFEIFVINYRPVLIEGFLESSYPSSTTMLVMCVMPTAIMELRPRIKNRLLNRCVTWILAAFTCFMVAGRLLSGVHWVTDIIGGALLSGALVLLYRVGSALTERNFKA